MRMNPARATHIIEQGRDIDPDLMGRCESRIEELFLAVWLQHVSKELIQVQVDMRPYRLDFLVYGSNGRFAVECDGAEFHRGGSIAGARADVRRDRLILARYHIPTLRFMGTEIAAEPHACVAETCQIAGVSGDILAGKINQLIS